MKCIIIVMAAIAMGFALPQTRVKNISTQTAVNLPVTLSFSFCQGEVMQPLTLKLGTTVTACQWDIKRTWPGGSIKHALVSFVVPTLAANDSAVVTLNNTPVTANNTPITKAAILATDFDAKATFVKGGQTYTASARALLQNASTLTYWMQGPLVTEMILRGKPKTTGGVADSDLVVQFEVRFYQGLQRARVSFVVDNTYEQRMHNVYYDVTLKLGNTSQTQVFAKSAVTHYLRSRWRKVFYWGTTPGATEIHNDIPYIISTGLIERYSVTGSSLSADEKTEWQNNWNAADRDIMGSGFICTYMPTTGERWDIGPNPEWVVAWLWSQQKWAADMACGNADLSGSWPIHYRPNDSLRIISTQLRPQASLNWYCMGNRISDIPWNLDTSSCPYEPDEAHQPNLAYVPYLLTGEHFYLEELYYWAAWNELGQYSGEHGRFEGETRGIAWGLRTISEAAAIAPDAHAYEKNYFNWIINQNITIQDSLRRGVHGRPEFNSLGWWQDGEYDRGRDGCINDAATMHTSTFMDDFLTFIMDHIVDLGFENAIPLRDWKARWVSERFSNPTVFNPYLGVRPDLPTRYRYFNGADTVEGKINDVATMARIAFDSSKGLPCVGVGPESGGYAVDSNLIVNGWGSANANYARGALSMYPRITNPKTQVSYNFINTHLPQQEIWRKWDFVPGPRRTTYGTGIEAGQEKNRLSFAVSPNPFNPSTRIQLPLGMAGPSFTLKAYDIKGTLVADLTPLAQNSSSTVEWNASRLSSGVYFIQMKADGKSLIKQVVLTK